jgi:acyl carrier protein
MAAEREILERLARVLVNALGVDVDDVREAATLQGDLGAESIDLLDIVFRIEREFAIKIPRGELFPDSIFGGRPDFVRDGLVTDEGMVELRSRLPYADLREFDDHRRVESIADLFTVGLLARYVAWKLVGGGDVASDVPVPATAGQSEVIASWIEDT